MSFASWWHTEKNTVRFPVAATTKRIEYATTSFLERAVISVNSRGRGGDEDMLFTVLWYAMDALIFMAGSNMAEKLSSVSDSGKMKGCAVRSGLSVVVVVKVGGMVEGAVIVAGRMLSSSLCGVVSHVDDIYIDDDSAECKFACF